LGGRGKAVPLLAPSLSDCGIGALPGECGQPGHGPAGGVGRALADRLRLFERRVSARSSAAQVRRKMAPISNRGGRSTVRCGKPMARESVVWRRSIHWALYAALVRLRYMRRGAPVGQHKFSIVTAQDLRGVIWQSRIRESSRCLLFCRPAHHTASAINHHADQLDTWIFRIIA